ncbi:MAG: hypothetical protein ACLTSX_12640 [Collinsella sp.]
MACDYHAALWALPDLPEGDSVPAGLNLNGVRRAVEGFGYRLCSLVRVVGEVPQSFLVVRFT